MNILKALSVAAIALVLAGCAHPLQIAPDLAKIERSADAKPKIRANVAYYLNDELRKEEKTTPGGGGDKVTTMPYRDIEVGFYKMLSNVFENVTVLKQRPRDTPVQQSHDYVIVPVVTPNSSSSSMMTWPPTQFTVDLSCDISSPDGTLLYRKQVVGQGNAEFDAFKTAPGLAGKLAMENALLKMQNQLLDLPLPAAKGR